MKRILVIVSFSLLLLAYRASAVSATGCTITFSGYTKSETLTNFPALVRLTNSISGFAYSQFASTNGWDLRFKDATQSTNLNYEIESWNTGGLSYVWVQIPALTNNTTIWAYWGDTNLAAAAPAFATNGAAWSQNYRSVWHLKESGLNYADSSSNKLAIASGTAPVASTGFIGGGQTFNGSNTGLNGGTAGAFALTSAFTMESWFRTGTAANMELLQRRDPASASWMYSNYGLEFDGNAHVFAWFVNTSGNTFVQALSPSTYNDSRWHHVAGVYNGSSLVTYVDGVSVATANSAGTPQVDAACQVNIGWEYYGGPGGKYFNGAMDEVRISSVGRSSNWIWACYQNMATNTVFQTYGAATSSTTGNPAGAAAIIQALLE